MKTHKPTKIGHLSSTRKKELNKNLINFMIFNMLLQSEMQNKEINNELSVFGTEKEEEIRNLNETINRNNLLHLPINVLNEAFYNYYLFSLNTENFNSNQIVNFMFSCLDTYGKSASVLFSYIDLDSEIINRLKNDYSNVIDLDIIRSNHEKIITLLTNKLQKVNDQVENINHINIESSEEISVYTPPKKSNFATKKPPGSTRYNGKKLVPKQIIKEDTKEIKIETKPENNKEIETKPQLNNKIINKSNDQSKNKKVEPKDDSKTKEELNFKPKNPIKKEQPIIAKKQSDDTSIKDKKVISKEDIKPDTKEELKVNIKDDLIIDPKKADINAKPRNQCINEHRRRLKKRIINDEDEKSEIIIKKEKPILKIDDEPKDSSKIIDSKECKVNPINESKNLRKEENKKCDVIEKDHKEDSKIENKTKVGINPYPRTRNRNIKTSKARSVIGEKPEPLFLEEIKGEIVDESKDHPKIITKETKTRTKEKDEIEKKIETKVSPIKQAKTLSKIEDSKEYKINPINESKNLRKEENKKCDVIEKDHKEDSKIENKTKVGINPYPRTRNRNIKTSKARSVIGEKPEPLFLEETKGEIVDESKVSEIDYKKESKDHPKITTKETKTRTREKEKIEKKYVVDKKIETKVSPIKQVKTLPKEELTNKKTIEKEIDKKSFDEPKYNKKLISNKVGKNTKGTLTKTSTNNKRTIESNDSSTDEIKEELISKDNNKRSCHKHQKRREHCSKTSSLNNKHEESKLSHSEFYIENYEPNYNINMNRNPICLIIGRSLSECNDYSDYI